MLPTILLGITCIAALAALIITLRVVLRTNQAPQPRDTPTTLLSSVEISTLQIKQEDIISKMAALTAAVAHGIEHVDRNEKRVRGIVVGAQRRFENSDYYDAAVDAEADSLPEGDGEGGSQEELRSVPDSVAGVEQDPNQPSAWDIVPGMEKR